ncbi:MAG: efflux RND transporter periplasmic adaptor subunit [Blastocatellia bacterium]|nr:efflux RND transporter periplasmic adaptor subunit [Blastocatellia bacterium]MDW8257539.1 efflux RND transporter periplasmic adaptor subunit [Acidobacteriota bacterium]
MNNRTWIGGLLVLLALLTSVSMYFVRNSRNSPPTASVRRGQIHWRIAANGRVEGVSEEILLGFKIPGRIRAIYVEEGERVRRDQVLAEMENAEQWARVEAERALLAKAEAQLALLRAGARAEEREQARAAVEEARAVAAHAEAVYERARRLHERGILSHEELERAEREWRTAHARLEAARQHYERVLAGSRPEEIAAAEAEVRLARARLREAEAQYEQTRLRAPCDGLILRRFMRPGEIVRPEMLGQPVLSMADDSRLRVRAEIDETDVAKIRLGAPAFITADAYRGEVFTGRVVKIGAAVGRKTLQSDNPAEKLDREILETWIELDPAARGRLIIGLRVDVVIELARRENVLIIPTSAVIERQGQTFVKVRQGDRWIERPVRLGARDEMHVEVLDGLAEGETILRAR